jgi:hypothetical protein
MARKRTQMPCLSASTISRIAVLNLRREADTFNDKQSQIAERKTGDGRGPGDHSREAGA